MLFTFYLQNTTILLTFNILYPEYHQKAYYLQTVSYTHLTLPMIA